MFLHFMSIFYFTHVFKHACKTQILEAFSLPCLNQITKSIASQTAVFMHMNELTNLTVSYLWEFPQCSHNQDEVRKHADLVTVLAVFIVYLYSILCVSVSIRALIYFH